MKRSTRMVIAVLLALAATAVAAEPGMAPFLWRVDGPLTTHYLMGSVHLLPEAADNVPDALETAYDNSDEVVFETDLGALNTSQSQLALLAAARSRKGLQAEIGPELFERVRRQARQEDMPMSLCRTYKAWFCALSLELFSFEQAGFSEEYGLDQHFYSEALTDGKSITWLEPVRQHLALFSGMNETQSRQFLHAALSDDSSGPDSPQALYRAWRDDDTGAVARLDVQFAARYPALYRRLIADRNRAWMPQLRQLLDGNTAELIVVGAAHWVGPDGLIKRLRAAGYRVHPVPRYSGGHPLQARFLNAPPRKEAACCS